MIPSNLSTPLSPINVGLTGTDITGELTDCRVRKTGGGVGSSSKRPVDFSKETKPLCNRTFSPVFDQTSGTGSSSYCLNEKELTDHLSSLKHEGKLGTSAANFGGFRRLADEK